MALLHEWMLWNHLLWWNPLLEENVSDDDIEIYDNLFETFFEQITERDQKLCHI